MIQVEIKNREVILASARALNRPSYRGDEYAAIGQAGKEVELRHPLQLTFRFLALRNFAGRREQDIASAEGGPAKRDFDPKKPTILGLAAPLERLRRPRSRRLH